MEEEEKHADEAPAESFELFIPLGFSPLDFDSKIWMSLERDNLRK